MASASCESSVRVSALGVGAGALYGAERLSFGLMNGFGLGASATALDAAAAHLMSVGVGGLPGGLPGAVREGEHLAGGALATEALEIAATGAVTMTAGTVGLIGLTAAGFLTALRMSMDPKHHASDDPNFAAHEKDPNWSAQHLPAHPNSAMPPARANTGRSEAPSFVDTDAWSHIQLGRGGVRQRVSGAALSPRGYLADRYGGDQADTPLPFSVPNRNLSDSRTKDDVVRVAIVNGPTAGDFHDHWLDGGRQSIERLSELHADAFKRDPEAAHGAAMLQIETGQVDTGAQKVAALQHGLDALSGRIDLDLGVLDAAIAKMQTLRGLAASVGTTGSTGLSRVVADPGVGRSR